MSWCGCYACIACHCVVYGGISRASSRRSSSSSSSDVSYQDSGDGRQQGIFTSPNHPQIYPTNVNCVLYTFTAAPQQIIEITFSEFNLQIPATSKSEYILLFLNLMNNVPQWHNAVACNLIIQYAEMHMSSRLCPYSSIFVNICYDFPSRILVDRNTVTDDGALRVDVRG